MAAERRPRGRRRCQSVQVPDSDRTVEEAPTSRSCRPRARPPRRRGAFSLLHSWWWYSKHQRGSRPGPLRSRGSGGVRAANLADVSNTTTNLFSGENGPGGVAVDPVAGKIYWVNFFDGSVRVGNLDGTGTASTLRGVVRRPEQPAPARPVAQPGGRRGPEVSGGAGINQELTCSQGALGPRPARGLPLRAPRPFAYEWQKDGVGPILGTDANFTPTEAGSYTCRVTATNQAGSDSQTSAPHSVTANPTVNFVRPAEDATDVQRKRGDHRRLRQGHEQVLRSGRLLARANQRRGSGDRQLRLVRPWRASLQAYADLARWNAIHGERFDRC